LEKDQFTILVDKLDKLTKLIALQVVAGQPKEQDKIVLLDSIGFRPVEIDRLLNKSPGYANAALSNIRKKQNKTTLQEPTPPSGLPTT